MHTLTLIPRAPHRAKSSRRALSLQISGWLLLVLGACLSLTGCAVAPFQPSTTLRIIAGSGFDTFEPILKRFGQEQNVNIQITYKGSLDIMQLLENPTFDYDVIWEGDSLWTTLGDQYRRVQNRESVMRSPIVFALKRSLARRLNWIGADVHMEDILAATEREHLRVLMTSATQSNSGASAYFGFLYAFADNPDVLTSDHLKDPAVTAKVRRILGAINRTSESSGWLRDLMVSQYDQYDGLFLYESHVIEANQKLVGAGREPLYVIYPREGLGVADFPLSFAGGDDAAKKTAFAALQKYLLSDAVQSEFAAKGRRIARFDSTQADPAVFNPEWGVDVKRIINVVKFPTPPVIREALDLYQTAFRKPSLTVYCLDFSGSMSGKGETQLKQAMRTLLDQQEASRYLLQASPDDATLVLIFNGGIVNDADLASWTVFGNNAGDLGRLLSRIEAQRTDDGTNIYGPVARALEWMQASGRLADHFPAVILMTDGQSNSGSLADVQSAITRTGLTNVPVYGITFGDASVDQLQQIANLTSGRVFDGTKDLVGAFRKAKGNN